MRVHSYRLGVGLALGVLSLALGACGTVHAGAAGSGAGPAHQGTNDAAASFAGATGWRVVAGSNSFHLTSNAGSAWQPDALPAGIPIADVQDINSAPGEATVLAAVVKGIVKVATQAKPGASWTVGTVQMNWPRGYQVTGAPGSLMLTQAPGGFVGLVAGRSLGMSTELVQFLTSANGGVSFSQAMSGNTFVWRSATFKSARNGIAVEGPAGTFLDYTVNGGMKWAQSAIPSGLHGANFGKPLVVSGGFLVVARTQTSSGAQKVVLLKSADGRSFSPEGSPLVIPPQDNAGDIAVAAMAGNVWVFTRALFASPNAGRTWTQVKATGLPLGVVNVGLSSPTTASAVVATNTCKEYKSDCSTSEQTFITTDSGRTWSAQ